jgi:hypothetical protein
MSKDVVYGFDIATIGISCQAISECHDLRIWQAPKSWHKGDFILCHALLLFIADPFPALPLSPAPDCVT